MTGTPSPDRGSNSAALDQWRGLALVFVLISHGFYFTNRVHGLGRVGVNLFFFISGVLVFKSLSGHHDRSSWERTKHFWYRRLRRLYPALVTYVLVMIPIVYALRNVPGAVSPSLPAYLRSVPSALLYGINYGPATTPMSLGHLWSVACEMQFYLLAPIIFLLGGKTAVRRNIVWGALLAGLALVGFLVGIGSTDSALKYHFEIAVWPMMLGFVCEYRKDVFHRIPSQWFHPIIIVGLMAFAALTVLMFCGQERKVPVIAIGSFAFVPCFLAYLGNRTLGGPIGRSITWLGERTYSIYLWQQPLTICNYLPAALHPLGAVASTLLGGLWFRWFERPFLSSKRQQVTAAQKFPHNRKYRRWTLIGFFLLFIGVGTAIFVARERYAERLMTQNTVALPASLIGNVPPNGVLLLGDSRIADWGQPDLRDGPVINAGIRGVKASELKAIVPEILLRSHPKIIVIQVGVNDLKVIGVRRGLYLEITGQCLENIETIADESQKSGARVLVLPIWPAGPVGWRRWFVWNDAVDRAVVEVNAGLEQRLAGNTNVVVANLFGDLAPMTDVRELYIDTLHLKPEAYATLSEKLAKTIEAFEAAQGR